jgi:sugar phosphate isomerase/epimerase
MSKVYVQPLYHQAVPDFVVYAKTESYNLEVATFAYMNVYEMDWQSAIQEHKRLLSSFTGKVSFHGVFQDIAIHSSDRKIAETSKQRILESIEVAQALNADIAVFHGNLNPLVQGDYYKKNWLDRNASFWQQILDAYNGVILLENVWEPNPEIFRHLIDQVASQRLKFCFDVAHANVYSKVPLAEWIAALRSDLTYIHFSDNTGEVDGHMEMGAGKINWKNLTQSLRNHNLAPEVVLEEGTLEKTKNSIAYMKQHDIYPF